eukprot:2115458-Pyramimonas_sp.AAC.1
MARTADYKTPLVRQPPAPARPRVRALGKVDQYELNAACAPTFRDGPIRRKTRRRSVSSANSTENPREEEGGGAPRPGAPPMSCRQVEASGTPAASGTWTGGLCRGSAGTGAASSARRLRV